VRLPCTDGLCSAAPRARGIIRTGAEQGSRSRRRAVRLASVVASIHAKLGRTIRPRLGVRAQVEHDPEADEDPDPRRGSRPTGRRRGRTSASSRAERSGPGAAGRSPRNALVHPGREEPEEQHPESRERTATSANSAGAPRHTSLGVGSESGRGPEGPAPVDQLEALLERVDVLPAHRERVENDDLGRDDSFS
jgi:hypothetical protein